MKQQSISPRKHMQIHNSLPDSSKFQPTHQTTIAELNKVSLKDNKQNYNPQAPFRIILPEYFNIPSFQDSALPFENYRENKTTPTLAKEDALFKKRMKDLSLLAEGMKRAKNIRQQSRYYFTQGILLHNSKQYLRSIQYFQKFLKIVIYLQDSKSIQLALNVIGCAYMYLSQYQKALQFHVKQTQVSQRADHFVSLVNSGMTFELMNKSKQAIAKYQQGEELNHNEDRQDGEQRNKIIRQLIQRIEKKISNNQFFVTQNRKSKSPQKQIKNSFIKQESSLIMKKLSNGKQHQQAKLKFAISSAEQGIEQHLKSSIKY